MLVAGTKADSNGRSPSTGYCWRGSLDSVLIGLSFSLMAGLTAVLVASVATGRDCTVRQPSNCSVWSSLRGYVGR